MKTNETTEQRRKWRDATKAHRARIRAEGGRQVSVLLDGETIQAMDWLTTNAKKPISEKSLIGSLILREFKRRKVAGRSK